MDNVLEQPSKLEKITLTTAATILAGVGIGLSIQQNRGELNNLHQYSELMALGTANVVKSGLRDLYCNVRGQKSNEIIEEDIPNIAIFNTSALAGYSAGFVKDTLEKYL